MTARPARRTFFLSAIALGCALLVSPRALFAQGEPTPFWIPDVPPPAKEAPPASAKKTKKAKKAPPKPESASDDSDAPPAPKKKPVHPEKKPPRAENKPARPAYEAPDDGERAEKPEPEPAKKKHRYEPLPPLPHIEPELPPAQAQPVHPAAPPGYPHPYQLNQPSYPAPAPDRYAPPPENAPQATQPYAPGNYPAPIQPPYQAPPPSYAPPRAQGVVPIDEQRGQRDVSDDSSGGDAPRFRRFSAELLVGTWAKAASDGQSHAWQLAYGLDVGVGLFRWLQLDVRGLRSGGTEGNAYVNATAAHVLIDGRLLGVLNFGRFAAFAGGGGGVVIEQTQLFLQDVGGDPSTLSSGGIEMAGEFVAGVRVRPVSGLTLRLEFDGLIRQGNFEPLFLFGAGWAF